MNQNHVVQNNVVTMRERDRDHTMIYHVLEIVSMPADACSAIPVSFLSKNPAQQTEKAANDTSTANSTACWRDTEKAIVLSFSFL